MASQPLKPTIPSTTKIPKKRVTMIKHVVGKVRTPSYHLPDGPFVFGIANTMDEEGAGKVVQSWAQSEPSQPQTSMRSFPATNRKALNNGCLSAKTQRDFAKSNPVMKTNPKSSYKKQQSLPDDPDHVYGIKTVPNDVPIKEMLKCLPADYEESDYPDRSNMKKKGRLPPAKSTKASRLLESSINSTCNEDNDGSHNKTEFKMKKFLKIESKIKAMMI